MNKHILFALAKRAAIATLAAASTFKPEVAILFSFVFGFIMIIGGIDV